MNTPMPAVTVTECWTSNDHNNIIVDHNEDNEVYLLLSTAETHQNAK